MATTALPAAARTARKPQHGGVGTAWIPKVQELFEGISIRVQVEAPLVTKGVFISHPVRGGVRVLAEPLMSRGRRMDEIRWLVEHYALRFAGRPDAQERALLTLYGDGSLTESDVLRFAGITHWDFLEMVGRHRDVLPSHDEFYEALDTLDRR